MLIALALLVHRCWQEPLPLPPLPVDTVPAPPSELPPPVIDTPAAPIPDTAPLPKPKPHAKPEPKQTPPDTLAVKTPGDTATPFVYAKPWGGRHFDSVTVEILCRENCAVLYALRDTSQFRAYGEPLTFRRNTTLWISGIRHDGSQVEPVRIDYVIERNKGLCPPGTAPFDHQGREACMDIYEWPNREDALPQTRVSLKEAMDSCARAEKRLCSLDEWQSVCSGPEKAHYPYASRYDERYCATQQAGPERSGHMPACRSYYGTYDMTGNLWEWTSTPYPDREGFHWVAGGNWEAGDQATCRFSRYSFYPQNRFSMVGFRCCQDIGQAAAKRDTAP